MLTLCPCERWPPELSPKPITLSPGLQRAVYTARLAGDPDNA